MKSAFKLNLFLSPFWMKTDQNKLEDVYFSMSDATKPLQFL